MITLYSGLVVKQPLVESLIPEFERASGVSVVTTFEPTSVLLERIAGGERPDLLLGVAASLHEVAAEGVLDPRSIVEIAVSAVGVAQMPETSAPEDDSTEAFLEQLLNARAVAYSLSGASGLHFMEQMRKRELLDRIDERAVRFEAGLTAEALVDGRADLAIQQVSELRSVAGPHLVRPIPHELQSYGRFAIGARPGAPAAATDFISALTGEEAHRAFASVGLSAP
ncbi:substrate-binding domain-containing protein [Agromyces sp. NPDC058136]|uniref:substrate-binding domain-containing protein n=1 Tax=Agromyces sp. NPDC058136 TaxID=3346354 RepID=UPI0036DD763C